MSELLKGIVEGIPEITYDLISRMLPGGIVVAALVVAPSIAGVTMPKPEDAVGIGIFLILAYAVGLAVSAFAHLCNLAAWFLVLPVLRCGKVDKRIASAIPKGASETVTLTWNPLNAMEVLGRAHEHIRASAPQERKLVMKLFAEVALLYNLATAILITLFWSRLPISVLLVASAFFFVAGVFRSVRTWYRHADILDALRVCDSGKTV